jgi:dolichol-phosphate mannosyltransferase
LDSAIIVFLPTYNERDNIGPLVEQLFSLDLNLSILIVDDQSPDGTGAVADQLVVDHPERVRVIHRSGARGRGRAGIVGLSEAARTSCEYVVEMDADLSHDPAQLPELLDAIQDADVVIGSRYLNGDSVESFGWLRALNSNSARLLSRLLLDLRETDPTSGYRIYRKTVLEDIPWAQLISPGPSIVEELLFYIHRMGAHVKETRITYLRRRSGRSKITPGIILRWIVCLLRIRWVAMRPYDVDSTSLRNGNPCAR